VVAAEQDRELAGGQRRRDFIADQAAVGRDFVQVVAAIDRRTRRVGEPAHVAAIDDRDTTTESFSKSGFPQRGWPGGGTFPTGTEIDWSPDKGDPPGRSGASIRDRF
jgi:hypothetical protein